MANKDLIRRALSVTATAPAAKAPIAVPTQRVPDAAAPLPSEASLSSAPPLSSSKPTDRGTASPSQPQRPQAPTPRTGPGSMMAFMTEQSEVHQEVVNLRKKLEAFDDATAARRIDAALITPSAWANRSNAHFDTEAFASLKQEIANAGGNVQPIKVRPVPSNVTNMQDASGPSAMYEIVFGHRRHRACLELGIPVLALVESEMKEQDLFVEMDRENREREDLSAWEQGVMYSRALERQLFPSARQLSVAIGRDLSNIGKAIALAKLPEEVVQAFGSPLNLQFRWAAPLKDAHQRDPENLLRKAREVADRTDKVSPAEVFKILTSVGANSMAAPKSGESREWKDGSGRTLASLTMDRKGRATLAFDNVLTADQLSKLAKAVDGLLETRGT